MVVTVQAILFDADGVIQHATRDLPARLGLALGFVPDPLELFIREVFAAELPSLNGEVDVVEALEPVVARWGAAGRAAKLVEHWWCSIEVDQALLSLIRTLRLRGFTCALATNQHRHRAQYMARALGYAELFDRSFYSCDLGFAKPDVRYFQAVLNQLRLAPGDVLFIDDNPGNIDAASAVGIRAAHFVHPRSDHAVDAMSSLLERFAVRLSG